MSIMPKGIILIRWDNSVGPMLVSKYPESLSVNENLLTQIYAGHTYNSREPGFSSITLRNNKCISFFSGAGENFIKVENYVIAVILRRDENPMKYREILNKIAAKILENIHNEKYKKLLPKLYKDLAKA